MAEIPHPRVRMIDRASVRLQLAWKKWKYPKETLVSLDQTLRLLTPPTPPNWNFPRNLTLEGGNGTSQRGSCTLERDFTQF